MTRARTPRPQEVEAARTDPRLLRARTANPHDLSWRTQGRCRTVDPETFYPLPTQPADMAVSLCRRCDVQADCLATALNAGDCEGVWGATTPRERRAMILAWRKDKPAEASEPESEPEPEPEAEPERDDEPVLPEFCAGGHEQTSTVRGADKNGRQYCRKCLSDAGKKGSAAWRSTVTQARQTAAQASAAVCGTLAAADEHWRRGEPMCGPCKDVAEPWIRVPA